MTEVDALRGRAARVGGCADLLDVRLAAASCSAERVAPPDARLGFELDIAPEVTSTPEHEALTVTCVFTVRVYEATDPVASDDTDSAEAKGADIATLTCSYAALYDLPLDPLPDAEECDAFARTTGVFALYPYARALIQDLTARMGLPALSLGVYRIPIDDPDDTP